MLCYLRWLFSFLFLHFLENYGYLPRVAFNMDRLFKRAGAHGKQSLTMAMGFGCNAAAIMSTRIIESLVRECLPY